MITKRISDYTDIDFDDPDIIHRYIVDTPSDEFVKKYKAKDKHICVVQDRNKLRFYAPTEYMCSLIIDDDKICQYKNNNWVPIYTFLVSQGSGGGGGGGVSGEAILFAVRSSTVVAGEGGGSWLAELLEFRWPSGLPQAANKKADNSIKDTFVFIRVIH